MSRGPAGSRPADNPFSSQKIEAIDYRFHGTDWNGLLARLARQGRGAIIGPHGSGKTTLLEGLADRVGGELVWIRLNGAQIDPAGAARANLPKHPGHRHTILIDGAEQLGPWAWRRLLSRARNAGTIVITSHTSGRLPTIHECRTDPALLIELVRELAPEALETTDLETLFHRHQGNIRACFRELYDRYAGRR